MGLEFEVYRFYEKVALAFFFFKGGLYIYISKSFAYGLQ